ncbi:unnamed protein product [Haemonchus placei]|uniref:SH3 domain-containing protein n=1 Tax=Haemonchus placei TaxID=6290 RepID=A0A0N4X1J0_HAEPC|nr:unnamed protein product [Haemonchus placei]
MYFPAVLFYGPLNPSPPSQTGRRLPLLPISLVGHYPTMSLPTHQGASKPQDHTLCFIDAFFSPDDSSGVSSCTTSDSLNPTHRVQSAFIPRHSDEVLLDIGDAVHVDRTCEDHWCYGTNLRTGMTGIFPSAVVCEIDIVEEICMGALPSNASSKFLMTIGLLQRGREMACNLSCWAFFIDFLLTSFISFGSVETQLENFRRAFKRSYDEYMAFAHPTEDIYLE